MKTIKSVEFVTNYKDNWMPLEVFGVAIIDMQEAIYLVRLTKDYHNQPVQLRLILESGSVVEWDNY